jgi:hypothetical protein
MQPSIFNYVVNEKVKQKVQPVGLEPKAYQLTYININQKDINIESDIKGLTQKLSKCIKK